MKTSALIKVILILSVFEGNLVYGTETLYSVDELLKLVNKENHCDCTDQIKPVCGSNRRTYANKCFLECSRKQDEDLRLVANISCEEIERDEDGACNCSEEINPVCGSNKKTYYNDCHLACNQKHNKKLKLILKVVCDIPEDQLNATAENQANEEETNRCNCIETVQEVCASNGLTYKNECFLKCHQSSDESLTLVSNAACDKTNNSKEDCGCPDILLSVCGSDGKTYPNKCYLECRQKDEENLSIASNTTCDEIITSEEDCECSDVFHPVCGSDGKTYHNKCYFKCRQNYNESLTLVSKTACDEISNSEEDCECSDVFHPVCGSDGKTYHNKCYFKCRQNDNESLTLVSKTACDEISNSKEGCVCPDEFEPVCGSDRKTYHNKCYFKCRQNDDENLTLDSKTACDEISNSKEEHCVCPDEFQPVCGSNGKTYSNKCYFKCRQNDDENLTLVSKTACDETSNSKEDCVCPDELHPVCGSDGKTYSNKCYFQCRQNDDESLTLVSRTSCDEISNSKEDCVCPDELQPVCGSDGKNYHNKCYFKCRQNVDEILTLVSKTACDEISNSKEDCVCPDKLHPVCGSDGKTYSNKCYLKCRQNDDESLTLVSKTACDKISNSKEDCVCPDEFHPVCGSDGKTYSNKCYLKCRQNDDESLTLVSKTACDEISNSKEDCVCPDELHPVCGSDRKTYHNKCYLKCRQNNDESLTLVSKTACDEISNSKEECVCPNELQPVCGSDGKTYPNKCYLKCHQNDNESLTLVSETACDEIPNSEEGCECPNIFNPFCGSDGKMYPNMCHFKCVKKHNESLTLVSKTACDEIRKKSEQDCECPVIFDPVCGSDGKTYPNICHLKCLKNHDENLTLVSKTACDEIPNSEQDCECPDIFDPVCGSDGKTYPNICHLKCLKNHDESLTLVSKTACDVIPNSEQDCECPDIFDPVCGSDGKTYPNICRLKCRQNDEESLTLVSKTACDEIRKKSEQDCECPVIFDPVCGSDGKTYPNICHLKCLKNHDESLTLVSKTACDEIPNSEQDCECPDIFDPVCGSDRKTYPNICRLKCRQNDEESLTLVSKTACDEIRKKSEQDCECPVIFDPVCGSDGKTYPNICHLKCLKNHDERLTLVSKTACDEISNSEEDCECPDIFDPVCGSDGKTYPNICHLKCMKNHDKSLTLVSKTACDVIPNSEQDCECPDIFDPVCGSDRKTYPNICRLKCRQNDEESLTLVSKTACDEIRKKSEQDCECPVIFDPVCGSDGKTYPNICHLKCLKNHDERLTLVSKTACDEISNSEEDCECPVIFDPVCGSDGKTYPNICRLKCVKTHDESLTLVSKTACDVIPNSEQDCECPDIFDPVCGSDGKTYPNICHLNCRQNHNKSLTLVSKTACDEIPNSEEYCECPDIFDPVCGSDGKTYPNICHLNCRQNHDESLTLVSKTDCNLTPNNEEDCECPDIFDPVCGTDGKTYPNICHLKCRQNNDESLTLVSKRACDEIPNYKEDCICPDVFHPVCGSNGKTYSNKCYFKCRQNDDENLTLVSKTACNEIPISKEDCVCPYVFDPVCGSDGTTYHNKCYFKCRQNDDESLTLVSKKACDEIPISKEDCVCPYVFDPVCGSDGKTYPNKCYFKCRQNDDENLTLVSKTACDEVSNSEENCGCPYTFDPVCGSDKKTYFNKCLLQCSQKTDQSLKLYANTSCRLIKMEMEEPDRPKKLVISKIHQCRCSMKFKPVCATDGEVYLNFCILKCYRTMNPELKKMVRVPCKKHHKHLKRLRHKSE